MNTGRLVVLICAVVVTLVPATAHVEPSKQETPVPVDTPTEPACSAHCTDDGGVIGGKTFKTYQIFAKLSQGRAVELISQGLASDGWHNITVTKDVGLITAYQKRKPFPITVVVKTEPPDGIRIEVIQKGSAFASKKNFAPLFCRILGFAEVSQ
jgi:hypothetical protein